MNQSDKPVRPGQRSAEAVAARLDKLFDVLHARDAPPLSNQEVAHAIAVRAGLPITAGDLHRLRCPAEHAGTHAAATDDPPRLAALADYFGVTRTYLTDPDPDPAIDAQLNLLKGLRDNTVRVMQACTRNWSTS